MVKKNNNGYEVVGNNVKVSSGLKVVNKSNVISGILVVYIKVKVGLKLVFYYFGLKVGIVFFDSELEFKKLKVIFSVCFCLCFFMILSGVYKFLLCVVDLRLSCLC